MQIVKSLGLGNTGKEYTKTRHNVGMMCIDYIARQQRVQFKQKVIHYCKQFTTQKAAISGEYAEFSIISPQFKMNAILLQPISYMNIIGGSVARGLKNFQIDKTQLFVFHDDLERKLGNFRVVKGTSFKQTRFKRYECGFSLCPQ
ncbi:peptidyl-trna hydrolase [Stylonychia lemnae]|uniref:peptidyl-tRNA hydrolase n=1 Tax=Stylonychia lemnae TaxID=5949 RepID=A0A078ABZ8_STYLE|nr:peptidyl-trna hydrolase [Stylonychia lemnae]|eukprot:CDW78303.1 peptidyl-trna hydrolase [Stylonychia lemnae]